MQGEIVYDGQRWGANAWVVSLLIRLKFAPLQAGGVYQA
jgi:hypothetical protein